MQRFSGKVIVVTGAAQGIGRGVALRAAAEGGRVLFVDRADFVAEVAAEAAGARRPASSPISKRTTVRMRRSRTPCRRSAASTS